ncbi:hypothetical protein BOX15_Mlig002954g1 [Macrostomum lignano]|uniref:Uncharacterized protein n=2 Tax=Macrostomum lignano TaxID=282301 RepID=A0A267E5A8_9PLAT|nr:hypothetical protein BOX15_Mlig002954g3 [Macrostomum lignano]PAA56763.1 hypothetical protein BOX15_Mlig002954g2 [Macrostomum lignano]PAA56766.1 hypothetical protein BOX15_Mlig002954g1 [Macrostomum lignano]
MLNEVEKKIILSGWQQAIKDKKALGMDVFMTLFEMFPQHQELFRDFKGKSRAELEKMPKMRAHALRVVNTLDGAIQSLDDMEVCASSLELIGASHKSHHLSAKHFEDLNAALAVVFERRLGKAFVDNKAVWVKLLQGIIPVIQRGL